MKDKRACVFAYSADGSFLKGIFYPKIRMVSSVVDLCVTLFRDKPVPCIANVMEDLPNVVGRGTVRNYARWESGIVYVTLIYGYGIPRLVMTLSLKGMQAPGVTLSLKGMQAPGVTLSLKGMQAPGVTLSLKGMQAPGVTLSLKGMQEPGVTLSLKGMQEQ